MIKLVATDGEVAYGIKEYVCDNIQDLKLLPKNCEMGSKCYVINANELYIMNGQHQWVKIGGQVIISTTSALGVAVLDQMILGE